MTPEKRSVNAAYASNVVGSILVNDLLLLIQLFRSGTISAEEFVGKVAASGIALQGELDKIFGTLVLTKE